MSAAGGYSSLDNAPSDRGGERSGLLAARDVESSSNGDASAAGPPPSLRSRLGPTLLLAANALLLLALWRDGRARRASQGRPVLQAGGGGGYFNSWMDSILEDYTAQLDDLEGKVSDQGDRIDGLDADVAALREGTKDLPSLADQLRAEEASLREKVTGEIQAALDEVHGLESDVEDASSAATGAESDVKSLQDAVEELRKENESLRKELQGQGDATTIDFDDVSDTASYATVPDGYRGLDWENFMVQHKSDQEGAGFDVGVVSGDYVAYNKYGNPCSVSATFPFSVAGFTATPGYKTDMHLRVEGLGKFGKVDVYEATLGNPEDGPAFVDLSGKGFQNLVKLTIATSGGATVFPNYKSYSYLAIDNLLVY